MLPIIAQVRDRDLRLVGILSEEDLVGLQMFPARNDVGTWSLTLPHEVRDTDGRWIPHGAAKALAQPGAGIVVELPGGRRFSGPVLSPKFTETADQPRGAWEFTGVTDTVLLADRLAFPDPSLADAQESSASRAYDTRTGRAEALLHQYVSANIGPDATTSRRDRRLKMGANLGRGASRTKSARFANLLELCQELAVTDGLLFDVVQVGASLEFRTWTPADLTSAVRMDIEGDTLAAASYSYSGPRASSVIVLGQGEGAERAIRTRVSATSAADSAEWARVIEAVVDARGSEELAELDAKGDEVLAESGASVTSLEVTPSDVNARALGVAWWVGDLVTVTVAGAAVRAAVTSLRVSITPDGIFAGATVGDAVGFDPTKTTAARVSGVESRVSALERTGGDGGGGMPSGAITQYAGTVIPGGWLPCDGRSLSRTEYPALYAAIGTTYGPGATPGSTFATPDLRGRVPVGQDSAQAEFDALGEKGGAKSHTLTTAQLPAHNHGFAGGNAFSWGPGGNVHVPINAAPGGGSNNYLHTSQHEWNKTANAGSGGAVPNLPPYLVLSYIIRA